MELSPEKKSHPCKKERVEFLVFTSMKMEKTKG